MNLMIFCSNPVNGGTAKIYYETVMGLNRLLDKEINIYPCIDANNDVQIYKKIPGLFELPVISAEKRYSNLYGGSFIKRTFGWIKRSVLYASTKRKNINCICSFLRDKKIDSVLIHNGGYAGDDLCNQVLEAAYRCADLTTRRLYVLHNDMYKNFLNKVRFLPYDLKVSREATDIITVSEYTKNRILSSSFITKDIKVVYNGIDISRTMTDAEKLRIISFSTGKHNILMIGNFLDNKGQLEFIKVANLLHEKDDDYRFVIIGNIYDKEYYNKCISLIDKYQLYNIISIYSGINNAAEYISLFDVQAVPSMYDESFGLISVEAMSAGVPVVAFACGGIPEVVENGKDGFVVPIGDFEQMAEKIDMLVHDKALRDTMSDNCIEDYNTHFSLGAMLQRYVSIIKR